MILCCGEALIDMLPRDLSAGGQGFMPIPGGAIFNTAIGLGRLDADVGFFSSLSTDMFGEQLIQYLNHSNVDTSLCERVINPTTMAFVKLVDGHAQYSFFDENSALRALSETQLFRVPEKVTALHFGAISLIPEPCGTSYEKLMASHQDRVLSLDPNIRESFIQDENAHRARINRMIAMADIVKVSDEDLDWIADGESFETTIASWLEASGRIVLLTEGSKGTTAFKGKDRVKQEAIDVKVVDTIGAGDAFNAGFLAGLQADGLLEKQKLASLSLNDLKNALELATNVAALTVTKAGANPPWKSEI